VGTNTGTKGKYLLLLALTRLAELLYFIQQKYQHPMPVHNGLGPVAKNTVISHKTTIIATTLKLLSESMEEKPVHSHW